MNGTGLASQVGREPWALAPRAKSSRDSFEVRQSVGRLVEVRLWEIAHPGEFDAMSASLMSITAPIAGRVLVFADYRHASPFPQGIADAWSRAMRRFNLNVLRSAILVDPTNETFNLQLARVIQCAGLATRRSFDDPEELRDWLSQVSTPLEQERIDALLSG
jgi:hypothetical protein